MDQSPKYAKGGQAAPAAQCTVHGVPAEYANAFPAKPFSGTMVGVLYEDRVDPEYALAYKGKRNAFDIVILWRRGVDPEYALQFGDRRDLTVLDIADRWDESIPAEFATLV